MELCEYQVKQLFKAHQIDVLSGGVAYTPQEAADIFEENGFKKACVRAQLPLNLIQKMPTNCLSLTTLSSSETYEATQKLLETNLPIHQGVLPYRVYVEESVEALKSYAISIRVDTKEQKVMVAVKKGNQIKQVSLLSRKPTMLFFYSLLRLFKTEAVHHKSLLKIFKNLYALFETYSATAVEIDPLILRKNKTFVAGQGRIIFDDEALFRFPQISALKEILPGMERQALAAQYNFRYIPFKGNIACLVNGSGLGWASIDLLRSKGGKPACLLDVGTEPSKEAVAQALKLALGDPEVEGVFVNIFGGITRCDTIADGLINASQEISPSMPLVVRMDGTNAQVGNRLLFDSRLPLTVVKDLEEAGATIIQKVEALR